MSESCFCPRCGERFPDEEEVEEMAAWAIIEDGASVVCPGCATPLERLREELDALL